MVSRVKAGARIVSCLNGNHHNVIGLMQHPQPFDFFDPEAGDLPFGTKDRILPYGRCAPAC